MKNYRDFFDNMPTYETDRLILRRITTADAADMFEYSCKESVTRYLLWSPHKSFFQTKKYVHSLKKYYSQHEFFDWALVYKENGKMIGTCGFSRIDEDNSLAEIGYVISTDYWGLGLATEAARRVVSVGFDELEFNRIEARYMVENKQSEKVMKKLGMKKEGVHRSSLFVKGIYRDIGYYAILKSDYDKKK